MSLARELRRRGRRVLGPTVGALVVAYFALHAFQGERGILTWMQLRKQVEETRMVVTRTAAERARLEARIRLLRSDNLDPDLLDERARIVAGLADPDDYIILLHHGAFSLRP